MTKVVGDRPCDSTKCRRRFALAALVVLPVRAQQPEAKAPSPAPPAAATATGVALPAGYVIGPDDLLSVVFWRDKDMSADVVVRPDGKISLPLLNDVQAAGLTPDQLRTQRHRGGDEIRRGPERHGGGQGDPQPQGLHHRAWSSRPGPYPLSGDMTVLQLISLAGGLQEYADSKNIVIIRKETGKEEYFKFNYKDVLRQKNLQQNILLKPGDTVVVP